MTIRKIAIILGFAFAGWALCFATIGIGMSLTSESTALIIHLILAPIFFAALSYIYFTRFNFTSPLITAIFFFAFVILMDYFLVAQVILRSTEMFTSPIGTWIPFLLIFLSTFLTGIFVNRRSERIN